MQRVFVTFFRRTFFDGLTNGDAFNDSVSKTVKSSLTIYAPVMIIIRFIYFLLAYV